MSPGGAKAPGLETTEVLEEAPALDKLHAWDVKLNSKLQRQGLSTKQFLHSCSDSSVSAGYSKAAWGTTSICTVSLVLLWNLIFGSVH